jgi:hypothetical protein
MRAALALLPLFLLAPAIGSGREAAADLPQDGRRTLARVRVDLEAAEARLRTHPDSAGPHLDRLRLAYVLGVKEEGGLAAAEADIAWLEAHRAGDGDAGELLRAYRGAVLVAHARHGFNLNRKLRLLREAAPLLDTAVARRPGEAEIRYLRLVSGYYLPFFLGRKPMVREDFAALARILPEVTGRFPPDWYLSVAGFVHARGDLGPAERERLERAMGEAYARLAGARGKEARP